MTSISFISTLTILFIVFYFAAPRRLYDPPVIYGQPEQIHLSLADGYSQMWVTWLTFDSSGKSHFTPVVEYGTDQKLSLRHVGGESTHFLNGDRFAYTLRVKLVELKPDKVYHYRCGTLEHPDKWSAVFRFRTRPRDEHINWRPNIAIYGDLGLLNGVSIPFLVDQVERQKAYDLVIHNGDMAYDLDSDGGKNGDRFFRAMEPVTANVAYQTAVGNHEMSFDNFSLYDNRFTMHSQSSAMRNNYFYSYNFGPMHIIAFSSEFYYYYAYGNYPPFYSVLNTRIQYEWLERDLAEANRPENRKKHPWIMALGHRAMYCSSAGINDCAYDESILRTGFPLAPQSFGLENLFYKYGVDIVIGAHQHIYERLLPIYNRTIYNGTTHPGQPYRNPRAPIQLIVGAAGCDELPEEFVRRPAAWSAKRIREYGITELQVIDRNTIRLRQRATAKDKFGDILDEQIFIKDTGNPSGYGAAAWL